jgi:hypothetical protein
MIIDYKNLPQVLEKLISSSLGSNKTKIFFGIFNLLKAKIKISMVKYDKNCYDNKYHFSLKCHSGWFKNIYYVTIVTQENEYITACYEKKMFSFYKNHEKKIVSSGCQIFINDAESLCRIGTNIILTHFTLHFPNKKSVNMNMHSTLIQAKNCMNSLDLINKIIIICLLLRILEMDILNNNEKYESESIELALI